MRIFLFTLFILTSTFLLAQKKRVCFSIDDLPVVNYGINDSVYQQQLTKKLVDALKQNGVPAIGFVNENKLFQDGNPVHFQVNMLRYWVENGLELGNHTYSHPDYNRVTFREFSQDVLKGEVVTRKLLAEQQMTLRYFRHPYLHAGNPKAKADSLSRFLKTHGYIEAPVTIDNDDYLFARAYKRAGEKKDAQLMSQIGHDYVAYMESKVKYFEKQARSLFDRDINQILLIHASRLNSDYTDSLAAMFRKNGYEFISMEEALKDEVYKTEVTVFGNWGISWIDRWAMSKGKKGDFFREDPPTPEYIVKLNE